MTKKFFSSWLKRWSLRMNRWSDQLYVAPVPPMPKEEKRVLPWIKVDGDKTLRLDYPLNKKSVVFDMGGYEGDWASQIYDMYGCRIYIFEPVESFYINIQKRFKKNPDIKVYNFGLADTEKKLELSLEENSSSVYKTGGSSVPIKLKNASKFLDKNNISKVNLMKINIEGGEYDLLDNLIESGWASKVDDFQIQFHDFVPEAAMRMKAIQQQLAKTHNITYSYKWVWENWRRKGFRK